LRLGNYNIVAVGVDNGLPRSTRAATTLRLGNYNVVAVGVDNGLPRSTRAATTLRLGNYNIVAVGVLKMRAVYTVSLMFMQY
jgi:hypothetical protein